ncbi:MAG: hypothetical protein HY744_02425 [Deltaproteobacteria bacterium]|nr:hypothetical protein [Deltaproteobacteria bacterium]
MSPARTLGELLLAAAVAGCAPIPPPDVLREVEQVRESMALREASRLAPTAYRHADRLRAAAKAALEAGDFAGAQILGERALAAYDQAVALSRVARAEEVRVAVEHDAQQAERDLGALEAQEQRLAADIAALEQRRAAARAVLEPPSAADGRLRAEAVAALRLQASLLCSAAALLVRSRPAPDAGSPPAELAQAREELARLDGVAAPAVDEAVRARAGCLRALTLVRRGAEQVGRAPGRGDVLLAALSDQGAGAPRRDDRGIVVTLRGVFEGDGLSATGRAELGRLATFGRDHRDFPMLVVVHQAAEPRGSERARWERRGAALAAALGAGPAEIEVAGTVAPVLDPAGPYRGRNERVEVVFVSPEAW